MQFHATCVSIEGRGVLLFGDSGSGKSDVALRLIDSGATLVADDRVDIVLLPSSILSASPPEALRGLIEARGVSILTLPYVENIPLVLAVRLVEREVVERLPEAAFWGCLGVQLPLLSLHAFDTSICAKIRFYLQQA